MGTFELSLQTSISQIDARHVIGASHDSHIGKKTSIFKNAMFQVSRHQLVRD